jgi:hypothetical protein
VRFATIVGIIGGLFLLWVLELLVDGISADFLAYCVQNSVYPTILPWRILVLAASLPCFGVLVCMWAVSNAVARDAVFTSPTAAWIDRAAMLLFIDAGFVFLANAVMRILSYSHPGIVIGCLMVTFTLAALGLLAAVLSRYIQKAADLQETSEGTI